MECHYCSEEFKSKNELMFHRKLNHIEKVQICVNFDDGKCTFGDTCWFSHDTSSKKSIQVYKCNICEEEFKIKSVYMNHRKAKHSENIPSCKNEITGSCQYGSQKCWFNHDKIQTNENANSIENMNNLENGQQYEMMQKLVEMVEKYTQRIIYLENSMVKDKLN